MSPTVPTANGVSKPTARASLQELDDGVVREQALDGGPATSRGLVAEGVLKGSVGLDTGNTTLKFATCGLVRPRSLQAILQITELSLLPPPLVCALRLRAHGPGR